MPASRLCRNAPPGDVNPVEGLQSESLQWPASNPPRLCMEVV